MKAFYKIKRDGTGLWVKMWTTNQWPWFASCYPLQVANQACPQDKKAAAKKAFEQFVADVRRYQEETA